MILLLLSIFAFDITAASEFIPRTDDASLCGRRLMFSIVWGCLSTVFLCAWVSIHPNIPKPRRLEGIYRRFQLLFWMLVAPEIVLVISMGQWVAAGRIAEVYNNTRLNASKRKLPTWTRAHGHFIIMGGLTLVSPRSEEESAVQDELDHHQPTNGQVMSYEQFLHFVNDPTFEFPIMTEDDINDRTRADVLSKSIAVLQTCWFVVQCIARAIQHLAVTELELTTLGLCTVNVMTYIFWWHKPLDAKTQIHVYLKPGQSLLTTDDDRASFDSTTGVWGQRARRSLLRMIEDTARTIVDIFKVDRKQTPLRTILFDFFFTLPFDVLLLLTIILLSPTVLIFSGLMSLAETTTVPTGASHVPPFYTPNTDDTIAGAVFAIFGTIFGGIHLIGWNFTYPTLIERTLWRGSALLITVVPFYVIFVEHLARYSLGVHTPGARRPDIKGFGPRTVYVLLFVGVFVLIAYIFARLLLLVQSFALLRRQPASAFCSVDWIMFFPHLA